jgi:hypothetical protein
MKIRKPIGYFLAGCIVLIGAFIGFNARTAVLDGPLSPTGCSVHVTISDMQMSPGADYYADVTIRNPDDSVAAQWCDPDGQESMDNVKTMVEGMRWNGNQDLRFSTHSGSNVTLQVKQEET